jgi:hypothetical protein
MSERKASEVERRVGNPGERWEALKERVQGRPIRRFTEVADDWLALMWALDAFRVAGVAPPNMRTRDIEALNREKGNWFAGLLALLLQNRTAQPVGDRARVQGFSQMHQVDVAWRARREDPLICAETKVTGGPAYGSRPERGAMGDWTNRRKELKFAATDLKLYRRQQETRIEHWDVWRQSAPPKTFFLWGARLRGGRRSDRIDNLVREAQAVVHTYLDGAGIFAWRENAAQNGYEAVPLPISARVTDLDDVLHRIESEIRILAGPGGGVPDPVVPAVQVVRPDDLLPDRVREAPEPYGRDRNGA